MALARRRPLLVLVGLYSPMLVIGFSAFDNFGILVRQRVQAFPFLLLLSRCRP